MLGTFHAGNRGSNPLGDVIQTTKPSEFLTAFFITRQNYLNPDIIVCLMKTLNL
jgi:hypothetical protein